MAMGQIGLVQYASMGSMAKGAQLYDSVVIHFAEKDKGQKILNERLIDVGIQRLKCLWTCVSESLNNNSTGTGIGQHSGSYCLTAPGTQTTSAVYTQFVHSP